jgi:hypothetical protein
LGNFGIKRVDLERETAELTVYMRALDRQAIMWVIGGVVEQYENAMRIKHGKRSEKYLTIQQKV